MILSTGRYRLQKSFAHDVDESRAKAKFDKSKQQLEIKLPVIPPPPASFFHMQQDPTKNAVKELGSAVAVAAPDSPCDSLPDSVTGGHGTAGRATMDVPKSEERGMKEAEGSSNGGSTISGGDTVETNQVQAKWQEIMRQHDAVNDKDSTRPMASIDGKSATHM